MDPTDEEKWRGCVMGCGLAVMWIIVIPICAVFNGILDVINSIRGKGDCKSTPRRHGWKPDTPDFRDHTVGKEFQVEAPKKVPDSFDLRPQWPTLLEQGNLGSCTSNGIASGLAFDRLKQNLRDWTIPSRLFIYYNERAAEGTINSDSGAMIRDGIKSVATLGAPPETLWPYNISRFTRKPSRKSYAEALKHPAVEYARVPQDKKSIMSVIASGYPIVFGITVYESFMSEEVVQSGIIPMPGANESVAGGHCMAMAGYSPQYIIAANWWGKDWGANGYALIPWEYILNKDLTCDLWTMRATK